MSKAFERQPSALTSIPAASQWPYTYYQSFTHHLQQDRNNLLQHVTTKNASRMRMRQLKTNIPLFLWPDSPTQPNNTRDVSNIHHINSNTCRTNHRINILAHYEIATPKPFSNLIQTLHQYFKSPPRPFSLDRQRIQTTILRPIKSNLGDSSNLKGIGTGECALPCL